MKDLTGPIGRYEVLTHWGSSKDGEVYLGRVRSQNALGSVCALEVLAGVASPEKSIDLLEHETRSLISLESAQLVKLREVFLHEGRVCIASDFVGGETLRQLMRADASNISQPLAVALSTEIAATLSEVKSGDGSVSKLIHGDLCPENVIVTYDGRLVLAGYGVALARARAKLDRIPAGHIAYMAPERAATAWDVDERVDVYSLGLILWELLVGEPPIKGADDRELIEAARRARIPRPSSKVRVSRSLESLVIRATSQDRDLRFPAPDEMRQVLASMRSSQLAKLELSVDLQRRMSRHFQHKERALRTLMGRWQSQPGSSSRPTARPRLDSKLPTPASIPPKEIEARAFTNLEAAAERMITDDLVATTSSADLPKPKLKRRSRSAMLLLAVVVPLTIGVWSWYWPPEWKRDILYATDRIVLLIGAGLDKLGATLRALWL
jgi:serine/threonine-protein kinase